jgi:hypothetical protein
MTGLLVLGGMILAFALAIVIAALVNGHWSAGDYQSVPGFIVGGTMAYVGYHGVKRVTEATGDEELSSRGPYVFLITHDTVEFPGTQAMAAETWDRTTTTASLRGSGVGRRLALTNPGKKTRTYFARALGVDPQSVVDVLAQG